MFGLIMDYIIRAGLRINLQQTINLGVDPVSNILPLLTDPEIIDVTESLSIYESSKNLNDIMKVSLKLASTLLGPTNFTYDILSKYVPTSVNIIKAIIEKWQYYSFYLNGVINFNTEYSYECFSGHPDIVVNCSSHTTILDIKNTTSFPKMSKESSLQILAYYALLKQTIPDTKYIGFILPMQRDITICDVSSWDPSIYLQLLLYKALSLTEISISNPIAIKLGSHISKGKNITTVLENYATKYPEYPCQMFLANPRSGKRNCKTKDQILSASHIIKSYKLQYFTHTPYVINLCANVNHPIDGYWQQRIINEDLSFTVALGGMGVVVHTGAQKDLPLDVALDTMELMIRNSLPYATEQCPLLLETPCGEGTETLAKIEDLGNFFFRFSNDERQKLGLCVDTCHVFAAGYNPIEYLNHWEKYCHTPIKLIHFNDSARECGSHVDRHATPGSGYIGIDILNSVAEWAYQRNIPMVLE